MIVEKILNRIRRSLHKTHSLQFHFLVTVILGMLAVTIFIGGISIYEVDTYVQEQAENLVSVTCENEGIQIDDSFLDMEKSVKIMESYLLNLISSKEEAKDSDVQQAVLNRADEMFANVVKHTKGVISYYVRFAPEISSSTTGLFYNKDGNTDKYISFEPTDISLYDKNDIEHVGWYWLPYEAGEAVWIDPYYNQNNDKLMISYVVPMYCDEMFVGIVGMDFDYLVLEERVEKIKIFENGFAHLEINGNIIDISDKNLEDKIKDKSKSYLRTSRELENGMKLVLSADYDDIRQIRYRIAFKILLGVIVLSTLLAVLTVIIIKRLVYPLKKLTEASVNLSNGNYDIEIVDSDANEIKLLSMAFKNMSMRLHDREERLQLSANYDSLTGLRNTTAYKAYKTELDEKVNKKDANFGVAVFDINDLKKTNDMYGHDAGNELIVTAARLISDSFKESLVFRIGGDEFVVVLQNQDLKNKKRLFEQLDLVCANTYTKKANISISIAKGFAKYDAVTDTSFSDVFRRADAAMYENKRQMKK